VDQGLVESIPVCHVYPVVLCEDVPQLCVPCQINGVIPVRVCGNFEFDHLECKLGNVINFAAVHPLNQGFPAFFECDFK